MLRIRVTRIAVKLEIGFVRFQSACHATTYKRPASEQSILPGVNPLVLFQFQSGGLLVAPCFISPRQEGMIFPWRYPSLSPVFEPLFGDCPVLFVAHEPPATGNTPRTALRLRVTELLSAAKSDLYGFRHLDLGASPSAALIVHTQAWANKRRK